MFAFMRRTPSNATIDAEIVATRAAVLLRAGVQGARVFEILATEREDVSALSEIRRAMREGASTRAALAAADAAEWRLLSAAWDIAEQSGAPVAPALDHIAAAFRSLGSLRDRRAVLLAGPRSTVRLVAALPLLAVIMGMLMGFDPIGVLFAPTGYLMLGVGVFLMTTGALWARSLTRRVEIGDRVEGLEHTMLWIALGGGGPIRVALRQVADCVDRAHAEWVTFTALCSGGRLQRTITLSADLGVPVGALLLEEATALRARAHADLERAAEKLGVRVLIPLGVCSLPAFIVLGVLPVVFAMLTPVVG